MREDKSPPTTRDRRPDGCHRPLGECARGGRIIAPSLGSARFAGMSVGRIVHARRSELGLTTYAEPELIELLRGEGFSAERRPRNIGHNQARMTFVARPA